MSSKYTVAALATLSLGSSADREKVVEYLHSLDTEECSKVRAELADELQQRKVPLFLPLHKTGQKPSSKSVAAKSTATSVASETRHAEQLKSKRHRSRSQKENSKITKTTSEDPSESLALLRNMVLDLESDEDKQTARAKKKIREMSTNKSSPARSRTPSTGCEEKESSGGRKKKISASDKKKSDKKRNGSGSRRKLRRTKTSPTEDGEIKPVGSGDELASGGEVGSAGPSSRDGTPKRCSSKSKSPRGKSSARSLSPISGKKITRSLSSNITDSSRKAARTDSEKNEKVTEKKSHSNSRVLNMSNGKDSPSHATRSPTSRKTSYDCSDNDEGRRSKHSIGRSNTNKVLNVSSDAALSIHSTSRILSTSDDIENDANHNGSKNTATTTTNSADGFNDNSNSKLALNLKKGGNTPRVGSVPTNIPSNRKKESSSNSSSGRGGRAMTPRSFSEDKAVPRIKGKIPKEEGTYLPDIPTVSVTDVKVDGVVRDKSPGRSSKKIKPIVLDPPTNPLDTNYKIDKELGRGMYGVVWKATNVLTGLVVAVKQVDTTLADETTLPKIEREAEVMRDLNHPNIVKLHDSFKFGQMLYFVLEYVDSGTLIQLWKKHSGFKEGIVGQFVLQTLQGLNYMHTKNLMHRDIKAGNLLITREAVVKLADFGTSKADDSKSFTIIGSPYWMAPEIILSTGSSTASDIWSLGCTTVELISGKPPNFELQQMRALFVIVESDLPPIPDGITPDLKNFLELGCFAKTPTQRSTATELLLHPWIMKATPLVPGLHLEEWIEHDQNANKRVLNRKWRTTANLDKEQQHDVVVAAGGEDKQ